MILHPLFHWAPADRRPDILRRGLRINSQPVVSSHRAGYICLSQSPSQAWILSAAVSGDRGQEWDCWQVSLDHDDEVHIRPFFGNRAEEIRVHNHIPKARCWLVGTRTVPIRGRRY